jgi:hypothetical protein
MRNSNVSRLHAPTATKASALQRLIIQKHKPALAFSGVQHCPIFSEDYSMQRFNLVRAKLGILIL